MDGTRTTTMARRAGSFSARVAAAWRGLPHERRLAAAAAIGLFLTLFLPWYQETVFLTGAASKLQSASASVTGWGAFSFVEAAVLLVAAGVLVLLFQRAEGRAFHLPGGDGGVIMAAGAWTAVLVVWRIFDKQSAAGHSGVVTSSGIEWGIFVALAVAVFLVYAGSRIRAAHRPEPPLPGEEDVVVDVAATPARPPAPSPAPNPVPAPVRAARADSSEAETVRSRAEPVRAPGDRPRGWLSARPSHLPRPNPPDEGDEDETIRLPRPRPR